MVARRLVERCILEPLGLELVLSIFAVNVELNGKDEQEVGEYWTLVAIQLLWVADCNP